MSLTTRRSITIFSRPIRQWKIRAPRGLISISGFSTKGPLDNRNKFLKPLYDLQFEIDGTIVDGGRDKPKPKPKFPSPLPAKEWLAEKLRSQGYTVEEALPPFTLLNLAKKSGALDIGAKEALGVVRRYIQLEGTKEGLWEAEFCAEEKIQPSTLMLLSLILSKCVEIPRLMAAKSLMFSASRLNDPTAIISILEMALKQRTLNSAENIRLLPVLQDLAKTKNNPKAMVLLGRIYESQRKDDCALEMYHRASTTVPTEEPPSDTRSSSDAAGDALLRKGELHQRRGNSTDAQASFRRAALEHNNAAAHYRLAQLGGPDAESYEHHLLKAAASGIAPAGHDLALFYARRAGSVADGRPAGREKEKRLAKERVWNEMMAREWMELSAAASSAEGAASGDVDGWGGGRKAPVKKFRGLRGVRSR